jgi:hypothetical protein
MLIVELQKLQKADFNSIIQLLKSIHRNEQADTSKEVVFTVGSKSVLGRIFNSQKRFTYNSAGYFEKVTDQTADKDGLFLSDLFLEPKETSLIEFENTDNEGFAELLTVDDGGYIRSFSYPFTMRGIKYLRQSINNENTNAIAIDKVEVKDNNLTIQFSILLGGNRSYKKAMSYNITPANIMNRQVITWPNFMSPDWNEGYYLYNELPKNGQQDIRALPILADYSTEGVGTRLVLDNEVKPEQLQTILSSPNSRKINYEILKSDKPILGISFEDRSTGVKGGVLFRKNEKLHIGGPTSYDVGIDFGSNNTCICIKREGHNAETIELTNRRRFFIGKEVKENITHSALQHEMMFFTNEEVPSNTIKSLLLEQEKEDIVLEGGINNRDYNLTFSTPVFEKNIRVESTDFSSSAIKVNLSGSHSLMRFDLKWEGDDDSNNLKKSFLRTLLTLLQAEIFAENYGYISQLAWAFPGVDPQMLNKYDVQIWQQLFESGSGPIIKNITEAEAIYYYMKSPQGNVQAGANALGVGIDVGGSTTDIVIRQEDGYFIQESLYLAAGTLARQTNDEKQFLNTTRQFIGGSGRPEIKNLFIPEESNPYLFNQLLDNLGLEEVRDYYGALKANCPNLFVLNSYLTGIILMHTGMQAGKQVKDKDYVNTLDLHVYGKGGQIFDWILTQYPDDNYFTHCIKYGMMMALNDGQRVNDFNVTLTAPSSRTTNDTLKTEVGIGLCTYLNEVEFKNEPNSPKKENDMDFTQFDSNQDTSSSNTSADLSSNASVLEDLKHITDSTKSLNRLDSINLDVLKQIGNFNATDKPNCFDGFLNNLFLKFISKREVALMPAPQYDNYINQWNFTNFIQNHEIYKRAMLSPNDPIAISILALEAECFLERVLMPSLRK